MQGNILLKKLNLAQKIYEEYFLNKEFLCIYEEQGNLKEFKVVFNSGHFKHLTGVEFIKNNYQSTAKNFYKAVKAAIAPKITPGIFATIIGQSFFFWKNP